MADIFVSYTSGDRDWAFWIGKELEAQGHAPHIHEWEIGQGGDIYAWMEARHDAADHVLCVVSDAYLTAPYSTLERNAALWQAVEKRPGFALFCVVKPCRLPTLSDHIRRCELFGVSDEEARTRLAAFMESRSAPAAALFPGQAHAVSNIPIRVPEHFMGREDALAAVAAALTRYEGRVAITALHGLRGVGKTTLAAAYAERHRAGYRATWWIRAQTEPTMRADLVGLGVRLGWVPADEKEEPALARVAERLRQEGEGLLLIYDNAMDSGTLRPFLPKGGGAQVLVTSNAHAWRGLAEQVELRLWPTGIGADYLIARTGRAAERPASEALSDALGGLPLAHEQAAAYCERLDVSLAAYLKRFEATPAKLLDADKDSPAEYHDGLTVAKTFALAIDEAAKLHPAAEPLIVHAALLASERIPLFFFTEGREHLGEPLTSTLADDGLDEGLAALRAFALIEKEAISDEGDPSITTDCIRLHRLVREVASARCEGEMREAALSRLIATTGAVYPDAFSDNRVVHRVQLMDAITLALTAGDVFAHARIAATWMLKFGPEQPSTATMLADLAELLLIDANELATVRPLLERALAIRERTLGPNHSDTNRGRRDLGDLLLRLGQPAEALRLSEAALAVHDKSLGAEHTWTQDSAAVTADALDALGRHEEAAAVRERYGLARPDEPPAAPS